MEPPRRRIHERRSHQRTTAATHRGGHAAFCTAAPCTLAIAAPAARRASRSDRTSTHRRSPSTVHSRAGRAAKRRLAVRQSDRAVCSRPRALTSSRSLLASPAHRRSRSSHSASRIALAPAYNRPTDWSRQIAFEPGAIARVRARGSIHHAVERAARPRPRSACRCLAGQRAHGRGAWRPVSLRVAHVASMAAALARRWDSTLLTGASARAVARDLFLDGNTFQRWPARRPRAVRQDGRSRIRISSCAAYPWATAPSRTRARTAPDRGGTPGRSIVGERHVRLAGPPTDAPANLTSRSSFGNSRSM